MRRRASRSEKKTNPSLESPSCRYHTSHHDHLSVLKLRVVLMLCGKIWHSCIIVWIRVYKDRILLAINSWLTGVKAGGDILFHYPKKIIQSIQQTTVSTGVYLQCRYQIWFRIAFFLGLISVSSNPNRWLTSSCMCCAILDAVLRFVCPWLGPYSMIVCLFIIS